MKNKTYTHHWNEFYYKTPVELSYKNCSEHCSWDCPQKPYKAQTHIRTNNEEDIKTIHQFQRVREGLNINSSQLLTKLKTQTLDEITNEMGFIHRYNVELPISKGTKMKQTLIKIGKILLNILTLGIKLWIDSKRGKNEDN